MSREPAPPPRRRRRAPLDVAWLQRQALHYVERFETTRAGVRRVLEGRIRRRAARTGEDAESVTAEIGGVIEKLVALGYVNDRRFAENLDRRLRRQGHSRASIAARLRSKGVPREVIATLAEEDGAADELDAAWRAARKRGLGPFRRAPLSPDPERRARERQREYAALGRRGFSFDVARRVIEASAPPESAD